VSLRAGLDTEARGKILSPVPEIEPRSPGLPARSQTLYRLSYPAHRLRKHCPEILSILHIRNYSRKSEREVCTKEVFEMAKTNYKLDSHNCKKRRFRRARLISVSK
jgi:hypothetical protein